MMKEYTLELLANMIRRQEMRSIRDEIGKWK